MESLVASCLAENAVIDDRLEFKSEDGVGYGVFVSSSCSKASVLVSIPRSLCLSVDSISNYSAFKPFFEENSELLSQPDEVLAIGLMYGLTVKDPDCPWKLHVQTLPKQFNTTLFWSEEELQELAGHNVFYLTNMLKQRICVDFQTLYEPFVTSHHQLFQNIDLDIYVWALSIVYSRALDITVRGKAERVIVPVLDMLNHSPFAAFSSHETFHYDEETDCVQYRSPSDLAPGEQCYAVYGHYPNAKLLYTYGFVIPHNPVRGIDLWTKVTPRTADAEFKQKTLQENELTRDQTYDFSGTIRPNFVSPALLATIRVIQAIPEEYPSLSNAFEGKMISSRNEFASYTSLRELLQLRLKPQFAESERKELGEMLLNNVSSANRKLMALVVKVEERELIQETISLVDGWIEELKRLGDHFTPQRV